MTDGERNIGEEIFEGLREIKRGEVGRVVNVPSVGQIREKTGLSQSREVRKASARADPPGR